ncbi:hypothetical protein EVAR_50878_1 [Eumeta japonica]|uniref:Uncharacterized protein n=1 Tax=Eumeta variegata TaxID=151549 RepID=A0A4C1Y7I1_EUMVA|nr:hypothetical protein EVAR_50878_1 [Eumeta japonica]
MRAFLKLRARVDGLAGRFARPPSAVEAGRRSVGSDGHWSDLQIIETLILTNRNPCSSCRYRTLTEYRREVTALAVSSRSPSESSYSRSILTLPSMFSKESDERPAPAPAPQPPATAAER